MHEQSASPMSHGESSPAIDLVAHPEVLARLDELDHVQGADGAAVTLVTYSDFQCLHCSRAYVTLTGLLAELPGTFRLVVRHFPLVHEHPHAGIAAKAAEAAARQGRFWAMHDLLFANQGALDPDALRAYARILGLDVATFDRDLADPRVTARVERDIASGRAAGVRATPTFFLNGSRLGDTWDLSALRRAVTRSVGSESLSARPF